jgi:TetR/AcrR family transcriptional repressor of bet genes
MSRPSNTEERRGQIVRALSRVMATHGYAGASVARIAEAAGLTPGLIHYHFASKQEILLALIEGVTSAARRRIDARIAGAGPGGRARLHGLLDGLLATGSDAAPHLVACWALLGAEAARQREVRSVWEPWLAATKLETERLLRAACREEGRSASGVGAMAVALVAAAEGYYAIAAAAPSIIPAGSAAKMTRRMADGLLDSQPFTKGGVR